MKVSFAKMSWPVANKASSQAACVKRVTKFPKFIIGDFRVL